MSRRRQQRLSTVHDYISQRPPFFSPSSNRPRSTRSDNTTTPMDQTVDAANLTQEQNIQIPMDCEQSDALLTTPSAARATNLSQQENGLPITSQTQR